MQTSNQVEVDRFYSLLEQRISFLISRFGLLPTALNLPPGRNAWTTKGVYFFFEAGEYRTTNGKPRVVRVGSHTGSNSTIESRIVGEHLRDWGRSVFRRHLGTALIRKGAFDNAINTADREKWAQIWYSSVNKWAVHANPKRLHPNLHPLHSLISNFIGKMKVVWVEIANYEDRIELEKQCIRLLSNYLRTDAPIDKPSQNWLGNSALSQEIPRSGLWNMREVNKQHTPGFLEAFEKYFDSQESMR